VSEVVFVVSVRSGRGATERFIRWLAAGLFKGDVIAVHKVASKDQRGRVERILEQHHRPTSAEGWQGGKES
jgi:hypothetical protein